MLDATTSNAPTAQPQSNTIKPTHARMIVVLLAVLLILAPLLGTGLDPLASMTLQLLSLGILTVALWTPRALPLTRIEITLLLALLATILIYSVPLPAAWVDALSGRDLYTSAAAYLPSGVVSAWKPLSINPTATLNAGFMLLVPIAVYLGCRLLDARDHQRLVYLLFGMAAVEALLGLIQYGTGQNGYMLFAGANSSADAGSGTYVNRNHFAGLLEMTLPLALALIFASLAREPDTGPSVGWRHRAAFLGSGRGLRALAFAALALLLLLGIIFSKSRMGITMAMLGLMLTSLLFASRIGGRHAFGLTGTLVALVLGFGIAIGLVPVLDRFSVDPTADSRGKIFTATLTGIGQRLPLGTGPGTLPDAVRALQPVELGAVFINRAHNDYLEWVSDAGLIALPLIALAFLLYLRQWTRVYGRDPWDSPRFLQAGAGIGLLLLALHELVDFNLYMPANQAIFALLAGIFFSSPVHPPPPPRRRRHHRHSSRRDQVVNDASLLPAVSPVRPAIPTHVQIPNPFNDPTPAVPPVSPPATT
jgi:O-antigen ligase